MSSPRVLLHCPRDPDRTSVGALLEELGAAATHFGVKDGGDEPPDDAGPDLALADVGDDLEPLEDLLHTLEGIDEDGDYLPLILIAQPDTLDDMAPRIAHRDHAVLLAKPYGRSELKAAIRSALALRDRQRDSKRLREEAARWREESQRLREEAEAEARRRTQLLAAISHNLRTPVNEILLFCRVIRSTGPQLSALTDWNILADGLTSGADSLRELVDDLLDLARFDLGLITYQPVDLYLGPLLAAIADTIRPQAERKGLALRVACEPADLAVRTDPQMLERVLQNLATNAVKFTESGALTIEAAADESGEVSISVRDTGRGIPAEVQSQIFDEFAQLQNPERDRTKGTGLGLAICRRLVSAMGGQIGVQSEVGQGSTFTVRLPAGEEKAGD